MHVIYQNKRYIQESIEGGVKGTVVIERCDTAIYVNL